MPFVRGVAEFTRLRVDTPAQDLTLSFKTIPSRFEVRTSISFSVQSPPINTSKEHVGFFLEGIVQTLSTDRLEVLTDIILGVSMRLDIDISRIQDLDFVVSYF